MVPVWQPRSLRSDSASIFATVNGTPPTPRENRAVRNLVYDELCDLDICLRRSFVSSYRKRLMSALYDIIRLGEMDTVGTVHTLKLRIMFIDLKDHSSCTLKHGSPCEV